MSKDEFIEAVEKIKELGYEPLVEEEDELEIKSRGNVLWIKRGALKEISELTRNVVTFKTVSGVEIEVKQGGVNVYNTGRWLVDTQRSWR